MTEEPEVVTLEEGIEIMNRKHVDRVIKYLETGVHEKSHNDFVECYT